MDDQESRSRLFHSSCSRHSLQIASGHYGRLLTAAPPTVTVPLASTFGLTAYTSPSFVSFSSGQLSPTFSNLPLPGQVLLWYAAYASGVVALSIAPHLHVYRSAGTHPAHRRQGTLSPRHTTRNSTLSGVSALVEFRGAAAASATRAAVFRAPGILIGSEEYENGAISVFLRSTRVEYRDPSQSRLDHGCPSGSQMALSSRLPDDSDSQSRRMNLRFLFLGCPERPIRPEMITNTLFRRWFRSSLRFTNMHDCERNSELRSPVRSSSD